jgi:uncharacterized protein YciI
MIYVIFLSLAPSATEELARPGVMSAVMEAMRGGRPPAVERLTALGVAPDFAGLFVERLQYLLMLREAGILRGAGPFAELKDGMYLCSVPEERDARKILEEDPFYRAGLIDRSFTVRAWLAAL